MRYSLIVMFAVVFFGNTPGWTQSGARSTQECRQDGIFRIVESAGGTYPSPNPPRPELRQLYTVIEATQRTLQVGETVLVLLTDCPMQGHDVRTVRNPMLSQYQIYVAIRSLPKNEAERQDLATNEVCLIRLGLANNNNRSERPESSLKMTRCQLTVELALVPSNPEALRWLRDMLPPDDSGELPPRGLSGSPMLSIERALQSLENVPAGLRYRPDVEIERLQESLVPN